MTTRIEGRIRKLLAIAEDPGSSDAERDTVLQKAAALAFEHDLNIDDCRGGADQAYVLKSLAEFKRLPPYAEGLAMILSECFGVRLLASQAKFGRKVFSHTIKAFGTDSNVTVAVYVYTYLRREFLRRCREWKSKQKSVSASMERGFYQSLAHGLLMKLKPHGVTKSIESRAMIRADQLRAAFERLHQELDDPVQRTADASVEGFRQGQEIEIRRAVRQASPTAKRVAMGVSSGD